MNKGILHTLRTKRELIPLAGILSFAAAGAFSFCVYSLFSKSDVIIHKIGSSEPWEAIDPAKPQKMFVPGGKHWSLHSMCLPIYAFKKCLNSFPVIDQAVCASGKCPWLCSAQSSW